MGYFACCGSLISFEGRSNLSDCNHVVSCTGPTHSICSTNSCMRYNMNMLNTRIKCYVLCNTKFWQFNSTKNLANSFCHNSFQKVGYELEGWLQIGHSTNQHWFAKLSFAKLLYCMRTHFMDQRFIFSQSLQPQCVSLEVNVFKLGSVECAFKTHSICHIQTRHN